MSNISITVAKLGKGGGAIFIEYSLETVFLSLSLSLSLLHPNQAVMRKVWQNKKE